MEGSVPPGVRFVPNDLELLQYLDHYDKTGRPLVYFTEIIRMIDPYSRRPDQLPSSPPHITENVSYYYADCFYKMVSGREARNRHTLDKSGYWKSTDGRTPIERDGQIIGYKQNLRFRPPQKSLTQWVMTEYTLLHNRSQDTPKALCVIRIPKGNERNHAVTLGETNLPPAEPGNVDWSSPMGSYIDNNGIFVEQSTALAVTDQQPSQEINDMNWLSFTDDMVEIDQTCTLDETNLPPVELGNMDWSLLIDSLDNNGIFVE